MRGRATVLALLMVRLSMGAVFLWAAASKILGFSAFAEQMERYQMLPAAVVPFAAVCLVAAEVATGVLLVLGIQTRAAAVAAGAMLLVFMVALSQALIRGLDLSCGCFGGDEAVSWSTVARDGVMFLACVPLLSKRVPSGLVLRKVL